MLTTFEIKKQEPIYRNKFVAEIEWYSGDEDGYNTDRVSVDNDSLLSLANFLHSSDALVKDQVGSGDVNYESAVDYAKWSHLIRHDMFCEDRLAVLSTWKVMYFDEEGVRHKVCFK